MLLSRAITRLSPAAVLAVLTATAAMASGNPLPPAKHGSQVNARQLVREVVQNEIREQNAKPIYWNYVEIETENGVKKFFEVYETKTGTVKRLLAVGGKPLSPAENRLQDAQLEKILDHPSLARKAARERDQDGENGKKLMAMLPNAFLFQYDGRVGDLVRLRFRPNPRFHPPTSEAVVFHHMQGHLLVDPRQKRLAEADGRLTSEVKFWWGLLGHLDKGGTFLVKQSDIGGENWKLTRLRVSMKGKVLFFKTVGVQENERLEDYRENPAGMTLRQAVRQLEKATLPKQPAAE
ncbi:MAG TPA: hypothetical protein VNJ52_00460 [Patescibacteria group bacterium]|nr:hypothetical protein [Patescibacteria group bacterium]